jgi:hypothetical protein
MPDGLEYSMGDIQGIPHASEGAVTLLYVNGDTCNPYGDRRTTRIMFLCSDKEVHACLLTRELEVF